MGPIRKLKQISNYDEKSMANLNQAQIRKISSK